MSEPLYESISTPRLVAGVLISLLVMVVATMLSIATYYSVWLFAFIPFVGGTACGLVCNWSVASRIATGWKLSVWAWVIAGVLLLVTSPYVGYWYLFTPAFIVAHAGGYFLARWLLTCKLMLRRGRIM